MLGLAGARADHGHDVAFLCDPLQAERLRRAGFPTTCYR
jgi:hypothetical protein